MNCTICQDSIDPDEVPIYISGEPIHPLCDVEHAVCQDDLCMWWRCFHGGVCIK